MSDITLASISELTEDQARETFERIRWPQGPVCPHCGSVDRATKFQPVSRRPSTAKHKHARPGVWKCGDCDGQFTVTVNTVMERSHISMKLWLMAFSIMCSSKKGISALQLQRQLDIGSYRTAWFLNHRIREAKKREPLASKLSGAIEADETYIGGKPRKEAREQSPQSPHKRRNQKIMGRGTKKIPVVALIERDGRAIAKPVLNATSKTLTPMLREYVDLKSATLMTDEWRGYLSVGKEFEGGHHRVSHGKGEYARGSAHVNSAESFFALLKRGIHGSFHHVSPKHLERYCDEFSFRWTYRNVSDSTRTEIAIQQSAGKRLLYKKPVE